MKGTRAMNTCITKKLVPCTVERLDNTVELATRPQKRKGG